MSEATPNYGIALDGTRFWVIHHKQPYGPFDYQFSHDLSGIEMLYQRHKFGECCSDEELCADLKDFHLPLRVAEVATVILGVCIREIFNGKSDRQRLEAIAQQLRTCGMARYIERVEIHS